MPFDSQEGHIISQNLFLKKIIEFKHNSWNFISIATSYLDAGKQLLDVNSVPGAFDNSMRQQ